MITTKTVQQIVVNTNIKHYLSLGYMVKVNDKIEIPVEHLPKKSRCIIEVRCDLCNKELSMRYETYNNYFNNQNYYCCIKCKTKKTINTNLERHGVEFVSQKQEFKDKQKETNMKIYGVESVMQNKKFIEKMKKTNLNKYGAEHVSQLDDIQLKCKSTRIKNGFQVSDELKKESDLYRLLVDKVTRHNKKQLFDNWNGYDYYDGEYIKNNFKLKHTNKNYPSIDHKISLYYGFNNNIDANIIGGIENLCITKRTLNSKKNIKCNL